MVVLVVVVVVVVVVIVVVVVAVAAAVVGVDVGVANGENDRHCCNFYCTDEAVMFADQCVSLDEILLQYRCVPLDRCVSTHKKADNVRSVRILLLMLLLLLLPSTSTTTSTTTTATTTSHKKRAFTEPISNLV